MTPREHLQRVLSLPLIGKALHLRFLNFVVQVESNETEILEGLKDYYQFFTVPNPKRVNVRVLAFEETTLSIDFPLETKKPEPGKTKIKEQFHEEDGMLWVHKIQTGVNLVHIDDQAVAQGPLLSNLNQLINFINNLFMDHHLLNSKGQLFHAAGLTSNGKGIGFAGNSGKGKSTLCLHLLGDGVDFVSNDRLMVEMVDGKLSMTGVPKYPRINPGTIMNNPRLLSLLYPKQYERYQSLAVDELWDLEEKYDAMIEHLYNDCHFKLSSEMKGFVLLDWDRTLDEPTRLEPINTESITPLLPSVMKRPGILAPQSRKRLDRSTAQEWLDLLEKTKVVVLRGGVDFSQAVDLVRKEFLI